MKLLFVKQPHSFAPSSIRACRTFHIRIYTHIYTHYKSGGKGTKKNPHTQIYAEKNEKFVVFAREKGLFSQVCLRIPAHIGVSANKKRHNCHTLGVFSNPPW